MQSLSSSPTYSGIKTENVDNTEMEIDSKDFVKVETQQLLAEGKDLFMKNIEFQFKKKERNFMNLVSRFL